MLGITIIIPVLGMGGFSGNFNSTALLISTVYFGEAEVPVFIPKKSNEIGRVATHFLLILEFG